MQAPGTEMFHDWEDFYLIVGSAAGALIGIMFVGSGNLSLAEGA